MRAAPPELTPTEEELVLRVVQASCVFVICNNCEENGDVRELLTNLKAAANKSAVETQALNKKLEDGLAEVRREVAVCVAASKRVENSLNDLEKLKTQVLEQQSLPDRLNTAEETINNLQTTVAETKSEWTDVVKKRTAGGEATGPNLAKEVRNVTKQIKEEDARKYNIVIHNAAEPKTGTTDDDKRADVQFFHDEIATTCGVAFSPDDISDCLRMGKQGDKDRPILIKFSEQGASKKKQLFFNLNKYRDHQRSNRGPDDVNKPFIS